MSEIANNEGSSEPEKPVQVIPVIKFPPFPEPTSDDFDEDIPEEERNHYRSKFKDLNIIVAMKLHCTACDRHLGCSARNETRMRVHPMLRTLVCHTCHTFYNSGEFEKGDDGSELYCRWCGQGGQVYCCSDCPHVFCAKCIKRNLGTPKIKEIEEADDWKCFKCNNRSLWDLRALCWALLRYCDLKNKIIYHTQNPELKEAYQKDSVIDHSDCCKHKINKRAQKLQDSAKKKENKKEAEAKIAASLTKMPPTIQVKKFASVNLDDSPKIEKKAVKRAAEKLIVKNPVAIAPGAKITPVTLPPLTKKVKIPHMNMINPIRIQVPQMEKKPITYTRIRPRMPVLPQMSQMLPGLLNNTFNGFSSGGYNMINDNINLSLESLTQGLDMSAVAASMANHNLPDDDVVCTPDFPLEPLCEVTEDNDDDVQCITPGPVVGPKPTIQPSSQSSNLLSNPPPLVVRGADLSSDNIIQMTENDVTVNAATGGLKFRVDPQTLSSNKMYRLPDGRIFAINANPNMPGGYSATIVAVTETGKALPPKGATYAAKLSAVASSTPEPKSKPKTSRSSTGRQPKRTAKPARASKANNTVNRECDLHVPVEWYRYNLIDAVDSLEYALSRLHKLKKEATTVYLRSRTVDEMKSLHKTLERLLNTSATRFNEVRVNLNKGLKQYVAKKTSSPTTDDDDDDVEILPDVDDDPIFIDENSVDSNINGNENQEVDLTGAGSSEHNDSAENRKNNSSRNNEDPLLTSHNFNDCSDNDNEPASILPDIEATHLDRKEDKKNENDNENDIVDTPRSEQIETMQTSENESLKDNETEVHKNGDAQKHNESEGLKGDESDNLKKDDASDEVKEQEHDELKNDDTNQVNKDESEDLKKDKMDNEDHETNPEKNDEANSPKNNETDDPVQDTENFSLMYEGGDEEKESSQNYGDSEIEKKSLEDKTDSNEKLQDAEMSEEMIESLLKDDNLGNDNATNTNSMDVSEEL